MFESNDPNAGRTGEICLRPYQTEAVRRVQERIAAGAKKLLLVAPCGAGKTSLAGYLITQAAHRGQRTLFIAHRRELINQAYRRFLEFGIARASLGVIMADDPRRNPSALVQVASIDTLRHRAKPAANLVFVDEAHRAPARSYRNIAACYPAAVHLGLTATPFRASGEGLKDAYDELVVVTSPRVLIEQGYLVEPRIFTVAESHLPDLSRVRIKGGDYDESALARAMDRLHLVGNIVEHWKKHAPGVRTVAFATSVAHSKHITEKFQEAGIPAEHLDGATSKDERDAILSRLETGTTLIVGSCNVLAEGWDQPSVKCAILARPTKSTGLYLQQAGRILRPYQGQQAIILDHAGCALEHGLPQDDREFTLEGKKRKAHEKKGEAPVKICKNCHAVLHPSRTTCPECGYVFEVQERVPAEASGSLVEIDLERHQRMVQRYLQLLQIASERGYKPGWAFYKFRGAFNCNPPALSQDSGRETETVRQLLRDSVRRHGGKVSWAAFSSCTPSRAGKG